MITRILAAAAVALVLAPHQASAQGRPPQQVVLSPAALKSLTAQKQKSKTPLTARVGMRRAPASTVVTSGLARSALTSVSAIRKTIRGAR
jgi:hypothetical protein